MTTRSTRLKVLVTASVGLLALGACGSADPAPSTNAAATGGAADTAKVTLNLATFNQFGYEDLITEYQKQHPSITITGLDNSYYYIAQVSAVDACGRPSPANPTRR